MVGNAAQLSTVDSVRSKKPLGPYAASHVAPSILVGMNSINMCTADCRKQALGKLPSQNGT